MTDDFTRNNEKSKAQSLLKNKTENHNYKMENPFNLPRVHPHSLHYPGDSGINNKNGNEFFLEI